LSDKWRVSKLQPVGNGYLLEYGWFSVGSVLGQYGGNQDAQGTSASGLQLVSITQSESGGLKAFLEDLYTGCRVVYMAVAGIEFQCLSQP